MKNLILLVAIAFGTIQLSAQNDEKGSQEVKIKTNAECGNCKERIESKLNYTKGITFAELDLETKDLTVKFKSKKISLDEIRKIVSEIGYDADSVKANSVSQNNLPKCCQPGGMK
jgi:copper chaperone CopZ